MTACRKPPPPGHIERLDARLEQLSQARNESGGAEVRRTGAKSRYPSRRRDRCRAGRSFGWGIRGPGRGCRAVLTRGVTSPRNINISNELSGVGRGRAEPLRAGRMRPWRGPTQPAARGVPGGGVAGPLSCKPRSRRRFRRWSGVGESQRFTETPSHDPGRTGWPVLNGNQCMHEVCASA